LQHKGDATGGGTQTTVVLRIAIDNFLQSSKLELQGLLAIAVAGRKCAMEKSELQPLSEYMRMTVMSRLKNVVILLVALGAIAGAADAQQIDLTDVYPLHATDSIYGGVWTYFEFDYNNTYHTYITGWRNVYQFWLDNDGPRTPVGISSAGFLSRARAAGLDGIWEVRPVNVDGNGADSIMLKAYTSVSAGMPPGWNEWVASFYVKIDPINVGAQFCIDSAWCPPE